MFPCLRLILLPSIILLLGVASVQADSPSLILHEEAAIQWKQAVKSDPSLPSVEIPIADQHALNSNAAELIEACEQEHGKLNNEKGFMVKKRTVGLRWVESNGYRCAEMHQIVAGQKRWVAWMPVCYRNRLYEGGSNCTYIVGNDPGSPAFILADQGFGVGAPYDMVAIHTVDYACYKN